MPLTLNPETLPKELVTAIEANLGVAEAKDWLAAACISAAEHATTWAVSCDAVLTGGALSLCVAGTDSAGNRVVIKVPSDMEAGRKEIAALSSWGGVGCPKIFAIDKATSVFLMEYLPKASETIKADELFILALSLQQNSQASQFAFPSVRENMEMRIVWAEDRFSAEEYSHQRPDLEVAVKIYQRLMDTTTEETLLHGDFQRKNLIATSSGLRTLDPYPCIGDPVFDAAFWLALDYHDQPLDVILSQYPAESESVEFRRFFCWVWSISVIENRPYQKQGAFERQEFISLFRESAIEAMRHL